MIKCSTLSFAGIRELVGFCRCIGFAWFYDVLPLHPDRDERHLATNVLGVELCKRSSSGPN